MITLTILALLAAIVLLLPTLSDVVSLARLAIGRPRPAPAPPPRPARLFFLVPAHDEELLIADCVRSLLAQEYPRDRLTVVVVADNCTDRTAELARCEGAHTLTRSDPGHRGKPAAIAWALGRIALDEYDALVIVDADTVVARGFAAAVGRVPNLRAVAGQGFFDVGNRDESALTRMGAVLAAANHGFAYGLKRAAGLNVPLVGNGMCLGSAVLAAHGWTSFSITEDWELYAKLTAAGVRIEGLPAARLYSQEARSLAQSATQRQRWTAGRAGVLARYAGALLASRHVGWRQKLDALAELAAPGPALGLMLAVALTLAAIVVRSPGWQLVPWLAGIALLRPAIYAAAAITVDPAPRAALAAFAYLPIYAAWRLGNALVAVSLMHRDAPWTRTARHPPSPTTPDSP